MLLLQLLDIIVFMNFTLKKLLLITFIIKLTLQKWLRIFKLNHLSLGKLMTLKGGDHPVDQECLWLKTDHQVSMSEILE